MIATSSVLLRVRVDHHQLCTTSLRIRSGLQMAGTKDKTIKIICLGCLAKYLHQLPNDLVAMEPDKFIGQMTKLIQALLPKGSKTDIDAEESQLITSIIIEVAQKHVHFVADQIRDILTSKQYSLPQHTIMLKALSKVAYDHSTDIAAHNYLLGPVILPFVLLEDSSEHQLAALQAAIACFPCIKLSPPDKHQQMVATIGNYTIHRNPKMATVASDALLEFLKRNQGTNLHEVLGTFVNVLAAVCTQKDNVLLCFRNIAAVISAFIDIVQPHETQATIADDTSSENSITESSRRSSSEGRSRRSIPRFRSQSDAKKWDMSGDVWSTLDWVNIRYLCSLSTH